MITHLSLQISIYDSDSADPEIITWNSIMTREDVEKQIACSIQHAQETGKRLGTPAEVEAEVWMYTFDKAIYHKINKYLRDKAASQ